MERPAGVRMDQWQVLRQLTGGRKTASDLAERLSRRSDSVTRGLRTLEERGLVEHSDEASHTRPGQPAGWWALTAAGQELVDAAPIPPPALPNGAARRSAPPRRPAESTTTRTPALGLADRTPSKFRGGIGRQFPRPELLEVLAAGQQAVESTFVARLDGDSHDYLFIFDRRLG